MARTNRINFHFFSFLFALEKHLNKNLPAGVGGNGEWVTVLLPGVWGWFLPGRKADLPEECSSREIREWGTKGTFTLLCLPGFGNTGVRLWQLSKVELEYVHSQTSFHSLLFLFFFCFLDQNYRNTALGALRNFFTVTFFGERKHPGSSSS